MKWILLAFVVAAVLVAGHFEAQNAKAIKKEAKDGREG